MKNAQNMNFSRFQKITYLLSFSKPKIYVIWAIIFNFIRAKIIFAKY